MPEAVDDLEKDDAELEDEDEEDELMESKEGADANQEE